MPNIPERNQWITVVRLKVPKDEPQIKTLIEISLHRRTKGSILENVVEEDTQVLMVNHGTQQSIDYVRTTQTLVVKIGQPLVRARLFRGRL